MRAKRNSLQRFIGLKILGYVMMLLALLLLPWQSAHMATTARHAPGRALLVGINNYQHPLAKPTPGSEEDATDTKEFIKQQYGFLDGEIKLLLGQKATRANIVREFREWLINGTRPGERIFFLYSGHGSRLEDDNGDEADGYDEALAPYDASEDPSSFIRDDLLSDFIRQSSGRMVVMVFDSCFSGTIARGVRVNVSARSNSVPKYFPSPKELAALKESMRSGGKGEGDDYVVQPATRSRDLNLVVDKNTVALTGVIVFSAAQADQTAYSIRIGEQDRGALSYVFNEAQRGGPLPLSELERRIAAEIERLHRQKILEGNQQPAFEVFSDAPLVDAPLFSSAPEPMSPLAANPQSRVKLSISTTDGRRTYFFGTENGNSYNDLIAYRVSTDTAGFLYLIVFSEGNVATCIFPNDNEKENQVGPGTHRFPRSSPGFYAREPEGKDIAVALLSTTRLNLGERETYTWDEILSRVRNRRFNEYVRARGIVIKPTDASLSSSLTDWQAASIVLEAKKQDR